MAAVIETPYSASASGRAYDVQPRGRGTGTPVRAVQARLEREPDRAVHLDRARRDLAARGPGPEQVGCSQGAVVSALVRPREERRRVDDERRVGEPRLDGGQRGERRAELLPGSACSTASSSARPPSPARYASVAALHARQHAAAATGSSRPARRARPAPCRCRRASARTRLRRRRRRARARLRGRAAASDVAPTRVARSPVDPERRTERRLVDEAERRRRAAELDAAGDGRRRGARRPPRAPPSRPRRDAPRASSSRSSCQLPSSGSRGGCQSPIARGRTRRTGASSSATSNLTRAPRARPRCRRRAPARQLRRGVPAADPHERREQPNVAEAGLLDLADEPLGDDLRIGVDGLALLDAPHGTPTASSRAIHVVDRPLGERSRDLAS